MNPFRYVDPGTPRGTCVASVALATANSGGGTKRPWLNSLVERVPVCVRRVRKSAPRALRGVGASLRSLWKTGWPTTGMAQSLTTVAIGGTTFPVDRKATKMSTNAAVTDLEKFRVELAQLLTKYKYTLQAGPDWVEVRRGVRDSYIGDIVCSMDMEGNVTIEDDPDVQGEDQ